MSTATLPEPVALKPLSEVVESPRALRALEAAGFKTLGDVAAKGIGSLEGIKGVGDASKTLILRAIGPLSRKREEEEAEIEEGAHPIRLESPHRRFQIALSPAHRVEMPGGGHSTQAPLFIVFEAGEAVLSKEAWLMRVHQRDRAKVTKDMSKPDLPWRKAAVEWLRGHDTFSRREFNILLD